ncbi:hypothetical protein MIMGU_mgv1a015317mg [Erythranthe guttata]|uniref:Uncharacterized protein n=1 Tax=Erythranthe guttata TaxID=4155 RepID=A0A022RZC0_ERYGU|nr:PREDICTED: anther-specific protein LAT52-like [Erythranthe guttata]EYU45018.1 hypothetical protein MIMGU_mgv1a015317mg [Erythranthe guttata]|eukprot:XP_012848913.1 PREDICTED: anther-specific protein LAT52-like [Erythranthe guttata]
MAKAVALVSVLCIVALAAASVAHAHQRNVFNIEGDVYCDPCRVQFHTELSKRIPGATVRLECQNEETKAVTYSVEGLTNADGHYSLRVDGDHEKDVCVVKAIKSPIAECSEPMTDVRESRIVCTNNIGMHSAVRFANPIGFMTKVGSPQCIPVLQDFFADD